MLYPYLFFSVFCFLSSVLGYAQSTESNLQLEHESNLLVDDSSFNYYKIIEQRNFFRPKQDPQKLEMENNLKEKPKTAEKDSLDFILTGVIEIKNGYKAIVEQKSSKKGFYVSVNEAIEDYTVKVIMLNKILIEKDGKEFELKLQQGSNQNIPTTPLEPTAPASVQENDSSDDQTSPQTLRSNTIQQIRSGTRGTK